MHIFGHSHANQMIEMNNIKYINNACAYRKEERIFRKKSHFVLDVPG